MKKLLKFSIFLFCIVALQFCDSGSSSSDSSGDDPVSVTAVSLDKTTMGIVAGSTGTLTATVSPSNATNQNVSWSSSDTSVATVMDGIVTGVAVGGPVTITVTTEDGNYTDTCNVTVTAAPVAVAGVTLNEDSLTVKKGKTATLTATVSPSDATNQNVGWSSSDTAIATVSDGIVTGVAAGTATITVTTEDSSYTDTCSVTVVEGGSSITALSTEFTAVPDVFTLYDAGTTSYTWEHDTYGDDSNCAIANAYSGGGNDDEDWLISPEMSITSGSYFKFSEAINYVDNSSAVDDCCRVLYSTDYPGSGDPNSYTWTVLSTNTRSGGSSWTFVDVTVDVSGLAGESSVYFAFKYVSSSNTSATEDTASWEIDWVEIGDASVTGVSLNKSSISIEEGSTSSLVAAVSPSNALNTNVSWSSSDTDVATVSDGTVTAVAAGTATITVTTEDGGYTATCEVTVTEAESSNEATVDDITISGVSVSDTEITLSWNAITDTDCSGLVAYANGSSTTLTADSTSCTFTGLTAETSYTVTLTAVDAGSSSLWEYNIVLTTLESGASATAYTIINTAAELNAIKDSTDNYNGSYVLAHDVSLGDYSADEGWVPIASAYGTPFTGTFLGGGHVISDLTISDSSGYYLSLFGITQGATIKDLGVTNCSVSGGGYAGALIGRSRGDNTISGCYSTGSVSGGDKTGGLMGGCNSSDTLTYCYSTATVSGTNNVGGLVGACESQTDGISGCYFNGSVTASNGGYVGGLIGFNRGDVSNCYAIGSVTASYSAGGLFGGIRATSDISNCYSACSVSATVVGGFVYYNSSTTGNTVSSCYFDTTISGTSSAQGGGTDLGTGIYGLTMEQMKVSGNYDGWSFGSGQEWSIDGSINGGYPYLTNNAPAGE